MTTVPSECPFEDGPPHWVQRSLTHARRGRPATGKYALLTVAVGWLPLLPLAALAGSPDAMHSLMHDFGVDARSLLAAPLLVVAEALCLPRLGATVNHFLHSGLVPDDKHDEAEGALRHTRDLLNRTYIDIAIVVLAYGIMLLVALIHGADGLPAWYRAGGEGLHFSPAGLWHTFVSLPLVLVLIFRWLVRLALWTRLLLTISRTDLRLVASHPDHAAGLGFVGTSVRAFAPVAFAFMVIAAGRSAQLVLATGTVPTAQLDFNVGLLVALILLFAAPTLVFVPCIVRAWQVGELAYGALAARVGAVFEQKWLARDARIDRSKLETEDISATTHLYSVVANVYAVRFIPITLADAAVLFAAMLLPFVPVLFLAVPLAAIWSTAKTLFL